MSASLKTTNVVEMTTIKNANAKKKLAKKSPKTREHIKAVQENLKFYYESIERLYAFAEGRKTLKNKGYSDQAENYKRTSADIQRLPWTLNNLRLQISLLKRELNVLLEYGA